MKKKFKIIACILIMVFICACADRTEKIKLKEIIEVKYDHVRYHFDGLVSVMNQGEICYQLIGDEVIRLYVPDGIKPWKREKNCIWITDSKKNIGIMDLSGNIILPCMYEKIDTFLDGKILESYERTESGLKRCLWDRDRNKIYQITNRNGNDMTVVSENVFLIKENLEYFLIDSHGKRIVPKTYSIGYTRKECGYVAIGDMSYVGKPGYKEIYRADGKLAVDGEFEFVEFTGQSDYPFLTRRREDDDICLMTSYGKTILTDYAINNVYEETLYPLNKKLFYYRNEDIQNILDIDGNILHTSSYGPDENGEYPIGWMNLEKDAYGLLYGDGRWIVIDTDGKEQMAEVIQDEDLVFYQGGSLLMIYDTDSCKIYNMETKNCIYKGTKEIAPIMLCEYYALIENEEYRIFDNSGTEITAYPGKVKEVYKAEKCVYMIVEKDGKQGVYELKL